MIPIIIMSSIALFCFFFFDMRLQDVFIKTSRSINGTNMAKRKERYIASFSPAKRFFLLPLVSEKASKNFKKPFVMTYITLAAAIVGFLFVIVFAILKIEIHPLVHAIFIIVQAIVMLASIAAVRNAND